MRLAGCLPLRGRQQSIQLILHGGEKALAVANADGYFLVADLDLAFADVFDLADGHDIAAVRTDEFPRGKLLRDGLERHQREDRLTGEVYFYIVVEAFDIEDLLEVHFYHLVVGLDKDVSFLQLLAGQVIDIFLRLVYRFQETVVLDGLQQVVDGVDIESVHGIFAECGGKDYGGILLIDDTREFDAIDIRHLDIEKKNIDGRGVHLFLRFEGVGKDAFQIEEIDLGDVFLQDLQSQRLVIDADAR